MSDDKVKAAGYALIVCEICETKRYVETRQYQNGFPTTCIKCSKGM